MNNDNYVTRIRKQTTRGEIVLKRNLDFRAIRIGVFALLIIGCIAVLSASVYRRENTIKEKEAAIKELEDNVSSLVTQLQGIQSVYEDIISDKNEEIKKLEAKEDMYNEIINELDTTISNLVTDNKSIMSQYDNLLSDYNVLSARKELYDKYEYAVIYDGVRTSFNYDDIKYAEDLIDSYGFSPHIMFGIYGVESEYNPKCTNSESTARGIGQVLIGTAGWTWKDILGKTEPYNHDMAFDVRTNIDISVAYFNYLLEKNNGDLYKAFRGYRGRDGAILDRYIAKINRIISNYGNVYQLAADYKKQLKEEL